MITYNTIFKLLGYILIKGNNELLKIMFALQTKLNIKTNGDIWLEGKTKEGRGINWYRCIYMEAAEAIDSFNWKHWKDINSADDWHNLLVELVDIWHFIMSEAIRLNISYSEINTKFVANKNRQKLIDKLELIMQLSLDASINNKPTIIAIISEFICAIGYAGMDICDLYNRYIVKNQLNIFRQDNGYKSGNYQKIWQGKEDNVVAFEIMAKGNISPDELYLQLQLHYSNIQ